MIIDSLMFNDEYDMLEFRLKYLYDYVDKFIVVEADHTHSGNKKPLNFFNNRGRYQWAMDKIIYHPVAIDIKELDFSYKPKEFDFDAPQWKVENQQRNAIIDVCKDFSDDHILMISDCDEIPTRQVVEFRKKNNLHHPFACDQRIVAFYLDYVRDDIGWRGTIFSDMRQAREITPQGLRNMRIGLSPFPHAGWHFTFFGGAEQIKRKIQSYAHAEFDKPEYTDIEKINLLTKQGKGIFPDKGILTKVDRSFYPEDILKLFPESWWVK